MHTVPFVLLFLPCLKIRKGDGKIPPVHGKREQRAAVAALGECVGVARVGHAAVSRGVAVHGFYAPCAVFGALQCGE